MQRILATTSFGFALGVVGFDDDAVSVASLAERLVGSDDFSEDHNDDANFRRAEDYAITGPVAWCHKHCVPGHAWGLGCSACENGYNHEPPMSNTEQTIACPLPALKNGRFVCPDESLSLAKRRTLFDNMKPWDQINGETLDENWPATAGQTLPMSNSPDTTKWDAHYNGVTFIAYTLSRPKGERAPIHYHEVPQQICLAKGKVLVKLEGSADKIYTAPDCYLMPAYTKMSVISLEDKVENCLFRVPDGGLDWVVIEPNYYGLQGQWENFKSKKTSTKAAKLRMGYHSQVSNHPCSDAQCAIKASKAHICVTTGWEESPDNTFPTPANCMSTVRCSMTESGIAQWRCMA